MSGGREIARVNFRSESASWDQRKGQGFQAGIDAVASLPHVRLGRLRLGPRFRVFVRRLRLAVEEYRILIRECVRDVASLPVRIRLIHEARRSHCQVIPGPWGHQMVPGGPLERCTCTHGCIEDIRSFWVSHPWATVVERQIFADAWAKGVEFADRTPVCSCRLVPVDKTLISPPNQNSTFSELTKHGQSCATKTTLPSRRIQTRAVRSSGASGSSPKPNAQVPKSNSKKLFSPGSASAKRIGSTPEIVASESRYTDSSSTVTRSRVCSSPHFFSTEKASSGFVFGKAYPPRFVAAAKFPHFVKLAIRRVKRQLAALQDSKRDRSNPLPLRE